MYSFGVIVKRKIFSIFFKKIEKKNENLEKKIVLNG